MAYSQTAVLNRGRGALGLEDPAVRDGPILQKVITVDVNGNPMGASSGSSSVSESHVEWDGVDYPVLDKWVNPSAGGNTLVIAAPAAGFLHRILGGGVWNSDAVDNTVQFRSGTSTVISCNMPLSGGGGGGKLPFDFATNDAEALYINLFAAGAIHIFLNYITVPV